MSESVLEVLQKVKASIGDRKAYLYGKAILDILIGETPKNFSIFIKVHHAECRDKVMQSLPHSKQIYYTLGTSFTALDTFTINLMYVDLDEILNGNVNVQSLQSAKKDFEKRPDCGSGKTCEKSWTCLE